MIMLEQGSLPRTFRNCGSVNFYGTSSWFLFQKRFFVSDKTDETKWWIPINFVEPGGNFSNTFSSVWISSAEGNKDIQGLPGRNTPVVFNVQETGEIVFPYKSTYQSAPQLGTLDPKVPCIGIP